MKIGEISKEITKRNPETAEAVKKDLAFNIGRMLFKARLTMGMTQADLAKKIGTKQPAITRIENGNSLPSLAVLDKIAKKAFNSYLIPPRFAFLKSDPLFSDGEVIASGFKSGLLNKEQKPLGFLVYIPATITNNKVHSLEKVFNFK